MQSVDGEAYACRGGEEVVELRLAAQQRRDAAVLVREQRGRAQRLQRRTEPVVGISVVRDVTPNDELGRPLHGLAPAVALYRNVARQQSPVRRDVAPRELQ